jgi:hypothetical protein
MKEKRLRKRKRRNALWEREEEERSRQTNKLRQRQRETQNERSSKNLKEKAKERSTALQLTLLLCESQLWMRWNAFLRTTNKIKIAFKSTYYMAIMKYPVCKTYCYIFSISTTPFFNLKFLKSGCVRYFMTSKNRCPKLYCAAKVPLTLVMRQQTQG